MCEGTGAKAPVSAVFGGVPFGTAIAGRFPAERFGGFMRPLKRFGVSKGVSAAKFRGQASRTKAVNITGPMRGGIRL